MILCALLALVTTADVDKAALRAAVALPIADIQFGFETTAFMEERAMARIAALQEDLLRSPEQVKTWVEIARNYRDADQESNSIAYYDKAFQSLSTKQNLPNAEVEWLVEAANELRRYDIAETHANKLTPPTPYWKAAIAFNRTMEFWRSNTSRTDLVAKFSDPETLAKIPSWLVQFQSVRTLAKSAVDAEPSRVEAQKLMAHVLNAEAAIRAAQAISKGEQPKNGFLAEEAGTYLKEVVKLLPDDVLAAADLYAFRWSIEVSKEPNNSILKIYQSLPKPTRDMLDSLEQRFERLADKPGIDGQLALEAKAVAAALRGEMGEAQKWFLKATEQNPKNARCQIMRLDALALGKQYDTAASYGKQRLQNGFQPDLVLKVAKSLDLAAKSNEAYTFVLDYAHRYPDQPEFKLALVAFALRDPSGAGLGDASSKLQDLVKIASEMPDSFREDLAFYRGVLFGLIGDLAEAKRMLSALARHRPSEPRYTAALKALG